MSNIEEMTLEEKVDELLKFQRKMHKMAIIRSIFNLLIFFSLVILPIWGYYYMVGYLKDTMGIDFTNIGETLQRAQNIGSAEGLTDFLTK